MFTATKEKGRSVELNFIYYQKVYEKYIEYSTIN